MASWRGLLDAVLPVLDASPWRDAWTLGGGTGLAIQIAHRRSDDIDLFFTDARALRHFAPNMNPATRAICSTWQFPGHYVKLERPDGEIDFLVTAPLTNLPPLMIDVGGRLVPVDQPGEIMARKLRYRGSGLTARDVFDLAAVAALRPEQIEIALAALDEGVLARALDRLDRNEARFRSEMPGAVRPTASAEGSVASCVPTARDVLRVGLAAVRAGSATMGGGQPAP